MYIIHPRPEKGLQFERCELDTPCGAIVSRWILRGREFKVSVLVPRGIQCTLVLPDGTSRELGS